MWAMIAVLGFSPGCTVWQNARRTIIQEPIVYSAKHDRKRSIETYRAWADDAWREHYSLYPEICSNDDYALGFRDGFVDYVYAGGNGEPPPVPPRHFWNVENRNGEGHAAAAQWFAGYRHGAAVARNGGYRARATLNSSLRLGPHYQTDAFQYDAAPSPYARPQPSTMPAEAVPAPPAESLANPYREPSQREPNPDLGDETDQLPPALEPAPKSRAVPDDRLEDQGVGDQQGGDRDFDEPAYDATQPAGENDSPAIDVGPFPVVPEFDVPEPATNDTESDPFQGTSIRTQPSAPGPMPIVVNAPPRAAVHSGPVLSSPHAPSVAPRDAARPSDRAGSNRTSSTVSDSSRPTYSGRSVTRQRAYTRFPKAQGSELAYQSASATSPHGSAMLPTARHGTLLLPEVSDPQPRAYAAATGRNVDRSPPRRHTPAAPAPTSVADRPLQSSGSDLNWQFVR